MLSDQRIWYAVSSIITRIILAVVKHGTENLAWRIGGPQGSGINRIARLFARACAAQGMEVICRREYHSNIMGRHSYNDVVISAQALQCHRESTDILVTFDAESLCRHVHSLKPRGFALYADADGDVGLGRLPYLDQRLRDDLNAALSAAELPETTQGLLEMAEQRGVRTVCIPYQALLERLADELGMVKKAVSATQNMLAVAISAALIGMPEQALLAALEQTFLGKEHIVRMNREAVAIAYNHAQQLQPHAFRISLHGQASPRLLLDGTQSVALGKLAAGMGFQSYYPISPATDESTFLEAHAEVRSTRGETCGPLVLQVEDELAAINMASGAALTGARSATATSGPGFSLMAEGLGWAGMNEVPLVITLYQRGGPSTGMPTRTDQGDLLFALHAGHGEFPRIIIASGDVASCFYDAAQAFDYAERYQTPVIQMLDKALTSTLQTVPVFDTAAVTIDRGAVFASSDQQPQAVARFSLTASGISPRPLLGQPGTWYWSTGVEHSEWGQVSEDPVLREQMMEKRARKLALAAAEIPLSEKLEIYGDEDAAFTIFTWGSNKGAVLDALQQLSDRGIRARAVVLRLLWPFPGDAVQALLQSASPSVMVECNYSAELNSLFVQQARRGCDHLVLKYSGRPISAEALLPQLVSIQAGDAGYRNVLRNAYE